MQRRQFLIPYRLPSRNECIASARANRFAAAKLKQDTENAIRDCLIGFSPITSPCIICCTFIEGNRKRDVDNVESGVKFILDAMQKQGVLERDDPNHVIGAPTYTIYAKVSGVIVTVVEGEPKDLRELLRHSQEVITGDYSPLQGLS